MNQLGLLSWQPIARNNDPSTSHEAAREISQGGARARQQRIVLQAVKEHPGLTSFELSRVCGLDRYQTGRRCPELEKAGLVVKGEARTCTVSGRMATTWRCV